MNDDTLVPLASVHELRDWLASKEIPVHLWGIGQAKRAEDLWSELNAGESVLTDPPPQRQVAFVSVVVRRRDTSLTEVAQLLATGETRTRRWPPGEKMLPGEHAETAAYRCIEEELGVPRESCRIIPGTHTEASRTGESRSYPGLVTRYRMNQVEMEIPNLPDIAFSTPESDGSEDAAVKIHYWDWCPNTVTTNFGGGREAT
ncbi:MAG: NUDIX hydrolase [Pseudonocardiaceae bacterium]